jgi:hypothetical protein
MTHSELAAKLRRLIDEERFEEAKKLLPEYTSSAVRESPSAASEFLRSAIQAVKVRRAHYRHQLAESTRQRAYLGCYGTARSIDCDG